MIPRAAVSLPLAGAALPAAQGRPRPRAAGSVILAFRPAVERRVAATLPGPAQRMDIDRLSDEELIDRARRSGPGSEVGEACLAALYERHYPKVAAWCLRLSGDRHEAADLAQDVFLRVHERLASFRGESRFSTWLYTVTRSVVINRGTAARRRETSPLDEEGAAEPVEPAPSAEETAARREIAQAFRRAFAADLEPIEAQALYLHFVDGLTLPVVTDLLGLTNKSGAKALIVAGGRKLRRRFGPWLSRQSARGARR
jgi:RNA polymerase sigma-70 factor (ECF subfamily)